MAITPVNRVKKQPITPKLNDGARIIEGGRNTNGLKYAVQPMKATSATAPKATATATKSTPPVLAKLQKANITPKSPQLGMKNDVMPTPGGTTPQTTKPSGLPTGSGLLYKIMQNRTKVPDWAKQAPKAPGMNNDVMPPGYQSQNPTAPSTPAQQVPTTPAAPAPAEESQLDAIKRFLEGSSESYYKQQEALYGKARDSRIAELEKAYQKAVAEGQMSQDEAARMFTEASDAINQQAYLDNQSTDLLAQQMGIQNSQQMLGMKMGGQARTNSLMSDQMTERDQRVSDIKSRISQLGAQKDIDVANANSTYDFDVIGARAKADQMYNEQMGNLMRDDYAAQRDFNFDLQKMDKQQLYTLEQMAKQFGYDLNKMSQEQLYALDRIAKEHGYDLEKMDKAFGQDLEKMDKQQGFDLEKLETQHGYDLEKMDKQHYYVLDEMAKQFGYDLKKMDKQQIYQLDQMAKQYGYDLGKMKVGQQYELDQMKQAQKYDLEKLAKEHGYDLEKMAKEYGYDQALARLSASLAPKYSTTGGSSSKTSSTKKSVSSTSKKYAEYNKAKTATPTDNYYKAVEKAYNFPVGTSQAYIDNFHKKYTPPASKNGLFKNNWERAQAMFGR